MKTLKQLHEEQDNLPKVHAEVERELKKIPGVIAVDIGFKQTGGRLTDTLSFIVYVAEKKNEKDLHPEHIIPREMHGVRTDVVKIAKSGRATATLPDNTKYRPIKGGIQIGNGVKDSSGFTHFGTIGCFATRDSDSSIVGLSNLHVMFAAGAHGEIGAEHNGSKMGQPEYWESCYCCDCDLIGNIISGIRDGVIDAAICTLNGDVAKANEIEEIGNVAGSAPTVNVGGIITSVRIGDPVKKRGRTTGLKTGTVQSINYALDVDGTPFAGQLHITPDNPGERFFDRGDSGSALVNSSNQVVGLMFAFPFASGTTDPDGTGVAGKVHEVMSRLHISIPSGAFASGGGSGAGSIRRTSFETVNNRTTPDPNTNRIIADLEKKLLGSEPGKSVIGLYYKHRTEIRDMINHHRPATVAWQRNQGPAFLASIIKSVQNPGTTIQQDINGVSLDDLLRAMKSVLLTHGSVSLREDIDRFGEELTSWLAASNTAEAFVENIRRRGPDHVEPQPTTGNVS